MMSSAADDDFPPNPFRASNAGAPDQPPQQPPQQQPVLTQEQLLQQQREHDQKMFQQQMQIQQQQQELQQQQLQLQQQQQQAAAAPAQQQQPQQQLSYWGSCLLCCRMDTYSKYFDIDTEDVIKRLKASLTSFYRPEYFRNEILGVERNETLKGPDLYGPLWITMTLVFFVAATSNMHAYVHRKNEEDRFEYDINHMVNAFTVIFTFVFGIPSLFWLATQCMAMQALLLVEWICLYGYSMVVYIPASFLCLIPWSFIEWVVLSLATAVSALMIVRNVATPLFASDNAANAKTPPLIMAILGMHLIFLLILKFSFYHRKK